MMTRRTKGILILLLPVLVIGGILLSFIVVNTLLGAAVPGSVSSLIDVIPQAFAQEALGSISPEPLISAPPAGDSIVDLTRTMLNFALGLLGVLSFSVFFLCVPLGLYYIFTPDHKATDLRKYPELQHLTDAQLESVDRLSWGAFFGGIIWPLSTGLYLWALACLIPFFNFYAFFKLWIHGRRMSYIALKPASFQEFQERQRTAVILIAVVFTFLIGVSFFIAFYSASQTGI